MDPEITPEIADVEAFAEEVMGGPEAGQAWLDMLAPALNWDRPRERLQVPGGPAQVQLLLGRIAHCVLT